MEYNPANRTTESIDLVFDKIKSPLDEDVLKDSVLYVGVDDTFTNDYSPNDPLLKQDTRNKHNYI